MLHTPTIPCFDESNGIGCKYLKNTMAMQRHSLFRKCRSITLVRNALS